MKKSINKCRLLIIIEITNANRKKSNNKCRLLIIEINKECRKQACMLQELFITMNAK